MSAVHRAGDPADILSKKASVYSGLLPCGQVSSWRPCQLSLWKARPLRGLHDRVTRFSPLVLAWRFGFRTPLVLLPPQANLLFNIVDMSCASFSASGPPLSAAPAAYPFLKTARNPFFTQIRITSRNKLRPPPSRGLGRNLPPPVCGIFLHYNRFPRKDQGEPPKSPITPDIHPFSSPSPPYGKILFRLRVVVFRLRTLSTDEFKAQFPILPLLGRGCFFLPLLRLHRCPSFLRWPLEFLVPLAKGFPS